MRQAESLPYGPPQVHLPEDEGSHPGVLTEWWYGNFGLTDSKGRQYGAMVAYFNAGLRILSICDLEAKGFHHEVSFSTPECTQGVLDVHWGSDDRWFRTNPDTPSYHLRSHGDKISLNLDLYSQKPHLLVGGNGLIEWPFGSSYYYSLTRLQVKGQLTFAGKATAIEGIGWMDHQWMDFIPGVVDRTYSWFSVQLDNNTEFVLWQVVNPDESIESRHLTMMLPDNSVFHTQDLELQGLESWVSLVSGREYGILWRVLEHTQGLDLEIKARYPEQEIQMSEALGFHHAIWEGRMSVSGHLAREVVSGTGYAELIRPPDSQQ